MNSEPTGSTPTEPALESEIAFLFDRIDYEKTTASYPRHFRLESMRRLLDELDNPHQAYSIIHVAGTKGKGSVCRLIAGALNSSGILTGVYTSPHVESICERIQVGNELISQSELATCLQRVRSVVERLDRLADCEGFRKNSFFEIITAAALLHFRLAEVDKVVLEVGLGGRLDSTNVCDPELCVLTNISLDHTRQLGGTVDRIAREKAGIIKRGVPVVSGVGDPLAAREIHESCSVCNCDLMELGQDFHYRINQFDDVGQRIQFDTWGTLPESYRYRLQDVEIRAIGSHQVANAAIAVAALNLLPDRWMISPESVRQSMEQFSLIGRGELISAAPRVVVDMAHNVASIQALCETLRRWQDSSEEPPGQRTLIFASSMDKDMPGMLGELLPMFDRVIFTRFVNNPRSTPPTELLKTAREVTSTMDRVPEMTIEDSPETAWQATRQPLSDGDLLCVTGSAFLVAEIRPVLVRDLVSSLA